jgi:hypothetical protein
MTNLGIFLKIEAWLLDHSRKAEVWQRWSDNVKGWLAAISSQQGQ